MWSYCPKGRVFVDVYLLSVCVCFCRVERSTDQVIKPVNVEALSKWVGKIPADVLRDMAVIAPMLSRLGYDPHANPPNYGRPDPRVLDNTRRVSDWSLATITLCWTQPPPQPRSCARMPGFPHSYIKSCLSGKLTSPDTHSQQIR